MAYPKVSVIALSVDEFANNIMSKIPEKWHFEDQTPWYNLTRLYIPEKLRIRAKQLIHDNSPAGNWSTIRTIDLAKKINPKPINHMATSISYLIQEIDGSD